MEPLLSRGSVHCLYSCLKNRNHFILAERLAVLQEFDPIGAAAGKAAQTRPFLFKSCITKLVLKKEIGWFSISFFIRGKEPFSVI